MSAGNRLTSFQKTIGPTIPAGKAGSHYGTQIDVIVAYRASTNLVPGTFACRTDPLTHQSHLAQFKTAGYPESGEAATAVVVGIVTNDSPGYIENFMDGYDNIVNEGLEVQIMAKGERMLVIEEVASGTATISHQVWVPDLTTGVPHSGPTPGDNPQEFWIVDILDAETGLCAVSSWRKA